MCSVLKILSCVIVRMKEVLKKTVVGYYFSTTWAEVIFRVEWSVIRVMAVDWHIFHLTLSWLLLKLLTWSSKLKPQFFSSTHALTITIRELQIPLGSNYLKGESDKNPMKVLVLIENPSKISSCLTLLKCTVLGTKVVENYCGYGQVEISGLKLENVGSMFWRPLLILPL